VIFGVRTTSNLHFIGGRQRILSKTTPSVGKVV